MPLPAGPAFGLGGAWGWIEPDSDGAVDGQVAFSGHKQGSNGAVHQSVDGVAWFRVSGSQLGGRFAVGTDPTDTYVVLDPSSAIGFIAFPATPNTYSMKLGPGVTAQATVKLMQ